MEGQAKAPSATKALLFALLSLFVCPILSSVFAIINGNATMREIRESGDTLGGRFEGRFAQILGWMTLLVYPVIAIGSILAITFLGDPS